MLHVDYNNLPFTKGFFVPNLVEIYELCNLKEISFVLEDRVNILF